MSYYVVGLGVARHGCICASMSDQMDVLWCMKFEVGQCCASWRTMQGTSWRSLLCFTQRILQRYIRLCRIMVVWGRCFGYSAHSREGAQAIGICAAFLPFRRVWCFEFRRMFVGAAGSNRGPCVRQRMFALFTVVCRFVCHVDRVVVVQVRQFAMDLQVELLEKSATQATRMCSH